ncbi:MAG: hypothetical protein ACI9T7_002985, partial [Oleiphilaceae bacterium]
FDLSLYLDRKDKRVGRNEKYSDNKRYRPN